MFDHNDIDKYEIDEIPLDRDCDLISDIYMREFDEALTNMINNNDGTPYNIGCYSPVAVRKINENSLELSWYPNTFTRFHEVSITLPRDKIQICVGCWRYDVKPCIFVDHTWLEQLYLKEYSVFALIDAIGVKAAIKDNLLTKNKLIELRNKIDDMAETHGDISFISFADSLILKSNWAVGYFHKGIECSYNPEKFLNIIKEVEEIYTDVLGLKIYAILTQGSNEYYEEPLLHISKSKNHICLNSLGVPFAELLAIDGAVKKALKHGTHPRMQVYMDEQYYRSLQLKYEYDKNEKPKNTYTAVMKPQQSSYFYASCDILLENMREPESEH